MTATVIIFSLEDSNGDRHVEGRPVEDAMKVGGVATSSGEGGTRADTGL